ncbi:MAG: hypothetical protein B6D36_02665 [Planctomycetes bacterium UTPLA1]|nr:MAG: hypothetical protein B6D36_02665 [Planctomycetes bacterium UTPLA1]
MSTLQESLMEADSQAEHRGVVWDTLRRLASELDRIQIPYAVVGGIALQHFGIQRSTQDVDVLVTPSHLREIHDKLIGHGYALKGEGSRHLRDEISRVRIEFLVSGEYPGDGKPKSVQFPNPETVSQLSDDGIRFVNLEKLVELKLASAKSAAHRIKDRADVLELIHFLQLPADFAERLDPYVQKEFRDLAALPPPSERD